MTDGPPVRAVYDAMVVLQGCGSPAGVSRRCLESVESGAVQLCLSPAVLGEIDEVLTRPEIRRRFPRIESARANELLDSLRRNALMLTDVPNVFPLSRDPDDQAYTDLAIAAAATYLVTWNDRHLTYLMRQDTPEGVEFCRRFPLIRIVDPPTFVREFLGRQGTP
jgi:putative PIN family toxin of toxin-antitoxin system